MIYYNSSNALQTIIPFISSYIGSSLSLLTTILLLTTVYIIIISDHRRRH